MYEAYIVNISVIGVAVNMYSRNGTFGNVSTVVLFVKCQPFVR